VKPAPELNRPAPHRWHVFASPSPDPVAYVPAAQMLQRTLAPDADWKVPGEHTLQLL